MNIALILSGGTGTRVGSDIPKQYIKVENKMIITYCLDMFTNHADIDGIWIVCDEAWKSSISDNLTDNNIRTNKIIGYSAPGANRQLSIYNGLTAIRDFVEDGIDPVVIIHDAARPNLSAEYVSNCLENIAEYDGLMPVLPMKDTVYLSENGKVVTGLLNRSQVFAGQAPELYKLNKYLDVNTQLLPDRILSINGSTEPAILAGLNVTMIPGDENNYKITTRTDLEKFTSQFK